MHLIHQWYIMGIIGYFCFVNFLAHIYLSNPHPLVTIGNVMGDNVKGNSYKDNLPSRLALGVSLHRFIDDFMDNHHLSRIGKKRLWDEHGHTSGIIIDMYYDHLLAYNWHRFSDISLEAFEEDSYALFKQHWDLFDNNTQYMLSYMMANKWLSNYASLEGLQRALDGLSRRFRYENHIDKSVSLLEKHFDDYNAEFLEYFDEIIASSDSFIKQADNG